MSQIPTDPQRQLMQGLCLFLEKFGNKIDGGYEVFVPFAKLESVALHAQVQVDKGPTGVTLRYFPNRVVEGVLVDGGRTELTNQPKADEQK